MSLQVRKKNRFFCVNVIFPLFIERLRRLDDVINRALRAKSQIVGNALGVPPQSYTHLADLAVAEALGEVGKSLLKHL